MSELIPAISAISHHLLKKIPELATKHFMEWCSDDMRERRLKRLIEILTDAEKIAKEKGISVDDMRTLADHVGLPWLERASLQDDNDLRKAWANLFVSSTTDEKGDIYSIYVSILGELAPIDCKTLEYFISRSIAKNDDHSLIALPLTDSQVREALSATGFDERWVQISIENLIHQSCLVRCLPATLKGGVSSYGGMSDVISVTNLGINFYIAVTNKDLVSDAPTLSQEEIDNRRGIITVTSGGQTNPAVAHASSIRVQ